MQATLTPDTEVDLKTEIIVELLEVYPTISKSEMTILVEKFHPDIEAILDVIEKTLKKEEKPR